MKFNYQARTRTGEIQSGTVEAASKEAAALLLQKYGLYVTLLEPVEAVPLYAKKIKFFERISKKELVAFSRQLSIMFKTEVSLVEALKVLASQTKNRVFREKILKLSEEVEGGTPFSKALAGFPKLFSPFYVSMVKAGEASGTLSQSLEYLADHLEREYHLESRIRGAMIYPSLVVVVVIAVLTLMMFYVIPQLSKVLEETAGELPYITKVVISLSFFFKKWFLIVLGSLAGLLFLLFRYIKTESGKRNFDRNVLRIPLLGEFLKMMYLSRFAENLSTLISGGLPIAQALQMTGDIVGNTIYKEVIFETREAVRRGEPISAILSKYPQIFPPVFTQMTLVGEKTGTLDKSLMNVVDFYEKEVTRSVESLISILEPALIVFLGLVVGSLMASVLLPLYRTMGM